jgi:hypothetical protein
MAADLNADLAQRSHEVRLTRRGREPDQQPKAVDERPVAGELAKAAIRGLSGRASDRRRVGGRVAEQLDDLPPAQRLRSTTEPNMTHSSWT